MAELQLSILILQGASAEPYMLNISINISGNYCSVISSDQDVNDAKRLYLRALKS